MDGEMCDIRQLVSQLTTAHFRSYLLSQEWEEKPSRFADQLYFQGEVFDGESRYELYLPMPEAPRYQTFVLRAIYKLCGIEDREPFEIVRDMLATPIVAPPIEELGGVARVRVRNSDSRPLQLRIDSPPRQHQLLPGEAIELVCHVGEGGMLEIERGDGSLLIRARERG